MKSIDRNFKRTQKQNPALGEYLVLLEVVRGKKYTRRTLRKHLHLLDDKDMDESMKKVLIDHLYEASQKVPEECRNEGKNHSQRSLLTIEDESLQLIKTN